ncbi:hypothetical protein J6E39_04225 [bacterium]|nr:hypothetical protein [bacterium]
MKSKEEIVEEMQQVVEQMRIDDIEENPDSEFETFECDACGQEKPLAGSVEYEGGYRLCNDCVLIAETGFALNKIKNVKEVIDALEYKRLEGLCDIIKSEQQKENN